MPVYPTYALWEVSVLGPLAEKNMRGALETDDDADGDALLVDDGELLTDADADGEEELG